MTSNPLDIDEQIERIRRAREESDKFHAETRKLIAESDKFHAEQRKLIAEAQKHGIDRWLAPIIAFTTMIGVLVAATASVITLLRFAP